MHDYIPLTYCITSECTLLEDFASLFSSLVYGLNLAQVNGSDSCWSYYNSVHCKRALQQSLWYTHADRLRTAVTESCDIFLTPAAYVAAYSSSSIKQTTDVPLRLSNNKGDI